MAVTVMRAFCVAVIAFGLLLLASTLVATVSRADDARVMVVGDSICEGVMLVAGAPGYARRGALAEQLIGFLRAVPDGSLVYFCAGTNDAATGLRSGELSFEATVAEVVAIAKAKRFRMTWIGPVRTQHWWDRYSDQADTFLAMHLANTGIRYLSVRAIGFRRDELAADGIHLSVRGYRRIAELARPR